MVKFSHEEFKYELLNILKTEVRPFNKINETQYAIRCPICGDSRKDKRKTRFYMRIDLHNLDEPVLYPAGRIQKSINGIRCSNGDRYNGFRG